MTSRGSTLIEVLVAMLVLVSGVLAMAQLFLVAAATNAAARDTTVVDHAGRAEDGGDSRDRDVRAA